MQNKRMYGIWSMAIIICLVLVLFSLGFVSCSGGGGRPRETSSPTPSNTPTELSPEITETPEPTPPSTPEPTPPTILAETEDRGQAYIDSMAFMGDSTTYGLHYYNVLKPSQVWTPKNGTFSIFNQSIVRILDNENQIEYSIDEFCALKKPTYLTITLGVNGIAWLEEEDFKAYYKELIRRVQEATPDTKIVLNSMYPIAREYNTSSGIDNEKITIGNDWVLAVAEELGLRYLDTASVLKDAEGYLPSDYDNGDGMHLEKSTLELIVHYIRTHGYQ